MLMRPLAATYSYLPALMLFAAYFRFSEGVVIEVLLMQQQSSGSRAKLLHLLRRAMVLLLGKGIDCLEVLTLMHYQCI